MSLPSVILPIVSDGSGGSYAVLPGVAALTDGATIQWDVSKQLICTLTLVGDRTLALPTNLRAGATYLLAVQQDSSGGHALSFASGYKWPSSAAPVISPGANAIDLLSFYSDGVNMYGAAQQNFG